MNETQVTATRILAIIAERRSWFEGDSQPLAVLIRQFLDDTSESIRSEFDLTVKERTEFDSKKDSCI